MKKTLILTVTGGALMAGAFGVVAASGAANQPERPAGTASAGSAAAGIVTVGHHGHGANRAGGRGGRAAMLDRLRDAYDLDGDGRVTQAEIDEGRRAQIAAHDGDADGALDLAEFEALWLEAMRERMVRRFQRHDRDGDGMVTEAEFVETMADLVALRDRTGDDALGLDDLRPGRAMRDRGEGMRGRMRAERRLERMRERFPELFEDEDGDGDTGAGDGAGPEREL